jgi:chemotaxis protein histidine kinase CheA
MIGFFVVSDLAHKIEDLLAKMRDRKIDPSASVMDLLFQSVDILAQQIDNISNGQEEDKSILLTFDDLCMEFLGSSRLSHAQSTPQKKAPPSPQISASSLETGPSETSLDEFYIKQDLIQQFDRCWKRPSRSEPILRKHLLPIDHRLRFNTPIALQHPSACSDTNSPAESLRSAAGWRHCLRADVGSPGNACLPGLSSMNVRS